MSGRIGRVAYGEKGPTYGSRTPPSAAGEAIEMFREIEPEPAPSAIEAALARWAGRPDVEAIGRLKSLADELRALEKRLGELEGSLTDAIMGEDPKAEEETLEAQAAVIRRIRGREAAIPRIEALIPTQLIEHYETEIGRVKAEHAAAKRAIDPIKCEALEAKIAAEQLHQAWREALAKVGLLGDQLVQMRHEVEALKR